MIDSTFEMIVKNETLDDIVTVFALIQATPHLDMMIRIHNSEILREYGALEDAYARLIKAGVLANGKHGLAVKGPNWKPPAYMTEKRYI